MTNLAGTTITNPAGPAPTNTLAATNVMTGTNGLVGTNSINITNRIEISVQDRAVTPADQTLIVRIRQSVEPVLPSTASWAPVRFVANQGVVLVSGEVGDSQQKQQIVTIVSRTPGVARVVDDLQIVTASVGSNTISLNESGSSPSAQSATPNAMANQDQAFTIADRNLITELHQVVQPVIGNAEPVSPINFVANNGVITLLGSVPNDLQRQQVVRLVQRTPGVVRVVDQLQVNVQANATPGQIRTAPTPAPSTLNTPVPMPTGRLNEQNRTYPPSAPTPQQLQNTNTAVR